MFEKSDVHNQTFTESELLQNPLEVKDYGTVVQMLAQLAEAVQCSKFMGKCRNLPTTHHLQVLQLMNNSGSVHHIQLACDCQVLILQHDVLQYVLVSDTDPEHRVDSGHAQKTRNDRFVAHARTKQLSFNLSATRLQVALTHFLK